MFHASSYGPCEPRALGPASARSPLRTRLLTLCLLPRTLVAIAVVCELEAMCSAHVSNAQGSEGRAWDLDILFHQGLESSKSRSQVCCQPDGKKFQ